MSFDSIMESAKWELHKFHGDSTDLKDLYEVIEGEGNLLLYGGASLLWHRSTGGSSLDPLSDTYAHIGVGDTNTAAAATQTDLQGASYPTNKFRQLADMAHTDSPNTSGGAVVTFQSTFATGDANFVWAEWGIFNASTSGRMLNRKVEALGTKTSAATWQLTITLTLA